MSQPRATHRIYINGKPMHLSPRFCKMKHREQWDGCISDEIALTHVKDELSVYFPDADNDIEVRPVKKR